MIIGIDNGLNGGIAVLSPSGEIIATYVMPRCTGPRGKGVAANVVDARAFSTIVGEYPEAEHIAIERPAGAQDVNAVQSMADSFATCRTVIICRGRTLHALTAYDWQRSYWPAPPRAKKGGPKLPKFDTKYAAAVAARKIWPGRVFLATPRCTVAHDGIVDACLIAEHLRMKIFNLGPSIPPPSKQSKDLIENPYLL
jgi:hypothetical protein